MNWIEIKKDGLPIHTKEDEWVYSTHPWMDGSVLVYGYDRINFSPRYRVMYIKEVAEAKLNEDGNYITEELIITHWIKLERPV